jgi:hypothetical protein
MKNAGRTASQLKFYEVISDRIAGTQEVAEALSILITSGKNFPLSTSYIYVKRETEKRTEIIN